MRSSIRVCCRLPSSWGCSQSVSCPTSSASSSFPSAARVSAMTSWRRSRGSATSTRRWTLSSTRSATPTSAPRFYQMLHVPASYLSTCPSSSLHKFLLTCITKISLAFQKEWSELSCVCKWVQELKGRNAREFGLVRIAGRRNGIRLRDAWTGYRQWRSI